MFHRLGYGIAKQSRRGFTLVELAIVLVIIGLLIGGILVGQDMVRAAELQSIIKDVEQFRTASNSFKDKYRGLPGDLRNATQYWGQASSCNPTDAAAYTPPLNGTCNGNGDGMVHISSPDGVNTTLEFLRFWQHLSLSGILPGNYTGLGKNTTEYFIAEAGISAPPSRTNGVYFIGNLATMGYYPTTTGGIFEGTYGNFLALGPETITGYFPMNEGHLRPIDAYTIDQKMDDGIPGTGAVISNASANCTSTLVHTTARYRVTNDEPACNLRFPNLF